mmetsp:Transcript_53903/g.101244  ORF Transcript_53903/g.101244 Transcript_53903/m.101244 type:complete len:94 (+) Transcript_53903:3-284(+)
MIQHVSMPKPQLKLRLRTSQDQKGDPKSLTGNCKDQKDAPSNAFCATAKTTNPHEAHEPEHMQLRPTVKHSAVLLRKALPSLVHRTTPNQSLD